MHRAGRDDARDRWGSLKSDGQITSIDHSFRDFIERRLESKCKKEYASRAALVLHHVSRLGGAKDIDRWLSAVAIPKSHPFSGIYFVADLPDGEEPGVIVRVMA